MAENGTLAPEQVSNGSEQPAAQQAQSENGIPPELAKQMQTSLAGFVPGMKMEQEKTNGTEHGQSASSPETETQRTEVQTPATPTEPFNILKEKFGWEKPEDAVTEIEQLRAFKTNPVTTAEIEFENEFSENLFKAIQGGKLKEVTQMLLQQDRLDSLTTNEVTKENAADIIKLGMQLKYKDLTPQEIDYKFNKQFSIPKAPVQTDTEDDTEFEARKQAWKEEVNHIEMERIIEAKVVRPELETQKSKIAFPQLDQTVDEGYTQWQKSLAEQPQLDAEIVAEYKAFTPKNIETKLPFNDEANKIQFEFQYEPDSESFNKAVEIASDFSKLTEAFQTSDGKPDRKRFLDAMYFALNKEKVLKEAMNQTKNATIKSLLPDNRGTQRQFPQKQELSELDKQMQLSLNGGIPAR